MNPMKKLKMYILVSFALTVMSLYIYGCQVPQKIADKSGAQLWGENCRRCHTTPPPNMYNDDQWKAIVTHMQVRANISKTEADKIIEFLQNSN